MEWHKSSYSSGTGNCVEVAPGVHVRDSKLGEASPVLTVTGPAWTVFTTAIHDGQFD
ncbi:MAG TPA: DUF397 domain-containing protein [Pseudonocardiaceae bacterium]|nr:DUF397 domain-containing protein [Pseudonocardiaceae bacterium]